MSIWGDSKIQQELDGLVRNKAIHTAMAKKIQENGHDLASGPGRMRQDMTGSNTKQAPLTRDYKVVKDNSNSTKEALRQT